MHSSSSDKIPAGSEKRCQYGTGLWWHLFLSLVLGELGEAQTITQSLLFIYSHEAERQR